MNYNRLRMVIFVLLYSSAILGGVLFGVLYIATQELLGYHLNAIGVASMSDIPDSTQLMLQTFKTAAGVGMISNAIAIIVLMIVHIKVDKNITAVALFVVALPFWLGLFLNVYNLETLTHAGTPMIPNFIVVVLICLGFIISLKKRRNHE